MRAAVYTRLSLDRVGETSTERQEADCRALAELRGWDVVTVYRDRLSGYKKDVVRPGFDAFLADLRSGRVDVGVVWKLDRLTRQGLRGLGPVLDALEAGSTALVSVNESALDLSTPMGRGMVGILASVAEQESANTSLRVTSAKAAQARDGKPVFNGIRPFGYAEDRVTVVEEEAVHIRAAVKDVLAGRTVYDIARQWEREGVRSPVGGVMSPSTIGRVLVSPRMAGWREYKGSLFKAVWPPVLEQEVWETVCAVLESKRRSPRVRTYALTGGIFCGNCGGTLTPRCRGGKEGGSRQYVCVRVPGRKGSCGMVRVKASLVEDLVEKVVLSTMEHVEVPVVAPETGLGAVLGELRSLADRLKSLEDAHYVSGTLGKGRFLELQAELFARQAALEAKAGEMTHLPALGGLVDPRAAWAAWSLEERRQFVRAWYPRLEVSPARRSAAGGSGRTFQPGRVRFVDREGVGWRVEETEEGGQALHAESRSDLRFIPLF